MSKRLEHRQSAATFTSPRGCGLVNPESSSSCSSGFGDNRDDVEHSQSTNRRPEDRA